MAVLFHYNGQEGREGHGMVAMWDGCGRQGKSIPFLPGIPAKDHSMNRITST